MYCYCHNYSISFFQNILGMECLHSNSYYAVSGYAARPFLKWCSCCEYLVTLRAVWCHLFVGPLSGTLRSVFSVPPLPGGIEVVGFRLVPTIDKEKGDLAGA